MVVTPPPRTPKTPLNPPKQTAEMQPVVPTPVEKNVVQSQSPVEQKVASSAAGDEKFKILGGESQYLEVTLKPNEAIIADTDSLLYSEQGIVSQSKMTDAGTADKGFFGKIFGSAKRSMSGESPSFNYYVNTSNKKAKIVLMPTFSSKILSIDLNKTGGSFLFYKSGFLCRTADTAMSIGLNKKVTIGLTGSQNFAFRQIQGKGLLFLVIGGDLIEKELGPGETITMEASSLVSMQPSMKLDIKPVREHSGISMFTTISRFVATVTGPGKIFLQTNPGVRIAQNINETLKELNKAAMKRQQKKVKQEMHKISKQYQKKIMSSVQSTSPPR